VYVCERERERGRGGARVKKRYEISSSLFEDDGLHLILEKLNLLSLLEIVYK